MDIKFENKIKTELFCNIMVGECFAVDLHTPDEIICMKVYDTKDFVKNAVELQSGELYYFDGDEEVIPVNTELTVRLVG